MCAGGCLGMPLCTHTHTHSDRIGIALKVNFAHFGHVLAFAKIFKFTFGWHSAENAHVERICDAMCGCV